MKYNESGIRWEEGYADLRRDEVSKAYRIDRKKIFVYRKAIEVTRLERL